MRCKTCEYRLWNLESRQCPECGSPFRPSEFEFVPNSVQFCCPHCRQAYYGTGEKGHLVPPVFECARCGRPTKMDEMVLLPAEGVDEDVTRVDVCPWLDWRRLGAARAWLHTVGWALVRPGRLMRSLPIESASAPAWLFALLNNLVFPLIGAVSLMIFPLFMGFAGAAGPSLIRVGFTLVAIAVVIVVLSAAMIALWGLLAHGLLCITGQTASGLRRTYAALCYSSGASAGSAIPCVGFYFGWIWWAVSAVAMVRSGQRVHASRAAVAVLTFPALAIAGLIALIAGRAWTATPAVTAAPTATTTRTAAEALLKYTRRHGRAPRHTIELVAEDILFSSELVPDTLEAAGVPVGKIDLASFELLDRDRRDAVVSAVVEGLPDGIVAHRLGDFVFTYHGIDLNNPPSGLWLVIKPPEAPLAAGTTAGGMFEIATSESPTCMSVLPIASTVVAPNNLARLLAAQNALRAQHGLPPLPHPSMVTHDKPAVAAGG